MAVAKTDRGAKAPKPEAGPTAPKEEPKAKERKKYDRKPYPLLFDKDGNPTKLKAWPTKEWVDANFEDEKEREAHYYSTARHNLLKKDDFETPIPFLEHKQESLEKRLEECKAEIVQVRELGGDPKKIKAAEKMRKMLKEAEAIRETLKEGGTDVEKLLAALTAHEEKDVKSAAEKSAQDD